MRTRFGVVISMALLCGCSSEPTVPLKNHMVEMTRLARAEGLPAMRAYFEANKHLGQNAEGKSEQLLRLDADGWGYNWEQIEEKFNNYNKPILHRVENCKHLKPARRQIECLEDRDLCASGPRQDDDSCYVKGDGTYSLENGDKLPQLGWRNNAILAQYREALAAAIASANAEVKGQTQVRQQQQARWKYLCHAKGYGMVVQSTVLPINRFQGTSFWAKTVGVSPFAAWLCSDEAQSKKVFYMACPGDPHSSCAVVDGLPNNIQANNYINAFLYYAGTVKGQSGTGFNQDRVPRWRVISQETLKHFGIGD